MPFSTTEQFLFCFVVLQTGNNESQEQTQIGSLMQPCQSLSTVIMVYTPLVLVFMMASNFCALT
jgi:hypothetical protein